MFFGKNPRERLASQVNQNNPNRVTDVDEITNLLDRAEESWPDNDFVESVRDWFEEKKFITIRQKEGLENVISGAQKGKQ